jgi:hypothetical protein
LGIEKEQKSYSHVYAICFKVGFFNYSLKIPQRRKAPIRIAATEETPPIYKSLDRIGAPPEIKSPMIGLIAKAAIAPKAGNIATMVPACFLFSGKKLTLTSITTKRKTQGRTAEKVPNQKLVKGIALATAPAETRAM